MADEDHSGRQHKFLLFLNNNQVFVWDKDTVLTLRRKYRIVGSLAGSLPSNPRQNLVSSLPLVLLAEEANLLLEKNLARLVVNENASAKSSQEVVKIFREERKANMEQQIEKLKEIKKQKLKEHAEVIEEAKERKRSGFSNRGHKRKLLAENDRSAIKKQRCVDESEQNKAESDEGEEKIESPFGLQSKWKDEIDQVAQNTDNKLTSKKQGCSEESKEVYLDSAVMHKIAGNESYTLKNCEKSLFEHKSQVWKTTGTKCAEENKCEHTADCEDQEMTDCIKNNAESKEETAIDTMASGSTVLNTLDFNHKDTASQNSNQVNIQDATLICVASKQYPSLLTIRDAHWTFPATEDERLRYKVFLDLWEKGYYITQASKFGGDYLVYPGDPLRFHSYFVVTIVLWQDKIPSLDLVAVARLGSSVKKTSVLASVDQSGNVIYTSIQWPGFV